MKLLDHESNATLSPADCVDLVMDTVPLVMRTIRSEMRSHRDRDLSVPQFRALAYLGRNPGASLSDLAEHIGLTLPTVSKLVDRLEAQKRVMRSSVEGDRRRISLYLTDAGKSTLIAAASAARAHLMDILAGLTDAERETISQSMYHLKKVFGARPDELSGRDAS